MPRAKRYFSPMRSEAASFAASVTSDGQPFTTTTMRRDAHVEKMALGGSAAVGIVAVPLAIAALLGWVRLG